MSKDPLSEHPPLGETDPNLLYVAVGRAIHAWEGMEQALAYLYLKLSGKPDTPDNAAEYGSQYRVFRDRLNTLREALTTYSIRHHDQSLEGDITSLFNDVQALAITRHRIAHGHVTKFAEMTVPAAPVGIPFTLTGNVVYCWGPPFYGVESLRTNVFGMNAAQINAAHDSFSEAWNRAFHLTKRVWPASL